MKQLQFLVFFLGIIFAASSAFAEGCLTAECHAEIAKLQNLHGPAAAGECAVCHEAAPEQLKQHAERPKSFVDFKSPTGPDQAVCLMCHDNKISGKYVHSPVETQECVACHNPHGGKSRYFLNGDREADTCFQCHDNDKMVKKYLHGPVAAGECASCHNPHSSDNKYQLRAEPEKVCFVCHSDKEALLKEKHIHPPLEEGCLTCHNPHNSDAEYHLSFESQPKLCFSCHVDLHPELVDSAQNAPYKHVPVAEGACGSCHNPHATPYGKLLRSEIKVVCFDCHSDIGTQFESSEFKHGPVESDGCTACHNVHGSKNPFFLAKHFPNKFYNDYREGLYALCFDCHDEKMLKNDVTKEDTGFRNGNQNLHVVHVKIPGKGRSCKACHEVHASHQPVQVRKSVPFGSSSWQLPVNFTKADTGGSCVVGCHKPKTYDRKKAFPNK